MKRTYRGGVWNVGDVGVLDFSLHGTDAVKVKAIRVTRGGRDLQVTPDNVRR